MSITCCKDCSKRHPGCHSKCSKYIKEKSEWEEIRAKAHREQAYTTIYKSDFEMLSCIHKPRKYRKK